MPREFSLADQIVWLVISITTLVVFVPTAVSTVATTTDWTTALIDFEAGEMILPTWFTFGMNCALVLAVAPLAFATSALLIRRLRRGAGPGAEPTT